MATPDDVKRRQRLLRRAFDTLGTIPSPNRNAPPPCTPAETIGSAAIPPTEAAIADSVSSNEIRFSPTTAPSVLEEDRAFAQKLESQFQTIHSDYFTRFQLPATATREQIRQTYLNLVKTYHPDQLSSSQAQWALKFKDIFASIQEAYETLHDDAKKKAYIAQLSIPNKNHQNEQNSSPAKPEAPDPALLSKEGKLFLKKKDYPSAAAFFAQAFQLSPQAVFLALEGWALYLDPTRKTNLQTIKSKLEKALKLEPSCDQASYSLGVISRVEGDLAKAERYFRSALHSNPRLIEAVSELRLIEMRKKKGH